jgi:hypothetical protein
MAWGCNRSAASFFAIVTGRQEKPRASRPRPPEKKILSGTAKPLDDN